MSFVIMLDQELDAHLTDWPITAEESTLAKIRQVTQFASNPLLVPRTSRTMTRIETKSLTDTLSGRVLAGGIFQST